MKKLFLIICTSVAMFACASSGPQVIPIDKMEIITAEIFLANAYAENNSIKVTDSLDVYEPIFQKYGYTATDMLYTIQDISKRKSIRYSDVVAAAVRRLETDFNRLDALVVAQDTVDARILRRYTNTVYAQDSVVVNSAADTLDMRIEIPLELGSYDISFSYFIDPEDRNHPIVYKYGVIDSTDTYRLVASHFLTKDKRDRHSASLSVTQTMDSLLVVNLGSYNSNRTFRKPNMRFDSITITHNLPLETAKDSFMREIINIQPLFDRYYVKIEEDSSALPVDTTRLEIAVDSLPR